MNITTTKLQRYFKSIGMLALVAILATACSKKDDPGPKKDTPPPPTASTVPYYKLVTVSNLADSLADSNPTAVQPPFFFSLAYNTEQPAAYAKTTYWDICFSSTDNSFISANNGNNATNAGYQGPGKGGITIVVQDFDSVTAIPPDNAFKTGTAVIGTDDAGAFGNGIGWYLYDYGGTVVSDGRANKMHVAYALGNALKLANGTTLPARTIIVKLANGDYAKIKMISCYKNALTPDQMFIDTPHMFYTFQYVIVPAGSTKFEIK
jgi:hypothetical protein